MMSSLRDKWERLVATVAKRRQNWGQNWELCNQQSRSLSISEQFPSFSSNNLEFISESAPKTPSESRVKNSGSSQPTKSKLWYGGRRKSKEGDLVDIPEGATIHVPHLRKFSLREIRIATKGLSKKRLIARDVYKGRLADGSLVVVKKKQTEKSSINGDSILRELEISSIAAHPNVLRVLSYYITPNKQLVVYPLMVNGSLKSWLTDREQSKASLDWPTRKGIALRAARGLAYLHEEICDRIIIHRDIKGANILLDKDFKVLLADFGLGVVVEHNADFVVDGTIGHIAPEYLYKGVISEKSDVFSYGVFVLELITGQRASDRFANGGDEKLIDWVKRIVKKGYWEIIVDEDCHRINDHTGDTVKLLLQIALLCTRTDPKRRPKMSRVVRMFEDEYHLVGNWEASIKNAADEVGFPARNDYPSTNLITLARNIILNRII